MRTLGVGCALFLALGGSECAKHPRRNNMFNASGLLSSADGALVDSSGQVPLVPPSLATQLPDLLNNAVGGSAANVSQNLKQCLELRVGEAGIQVMDLPKMVVNARRRLVSGLGF